MGSGTFAQEDLDRLGIDITIAINTELTLVGNGVEFGFCGWITENSYLIGATIETDRGCLQDTFQETNFTNSIYEDGWERRWLIEVIVKQFKQLYDTSPLNAERVGR